MDILPLVSVICVSYNQRQYVGSAIRSVLSQTYPHIELIIVDDASTDGSQQEIQAYVAGLNTTCLFLPSNVGNCKAFNIGLAQCSGDYIIDLAGDDILLPDRVALGIQGFQNAGEEVGVHFSDVFLCDSDGNALSTHYQRDENGKITDYVPTGKVYSDLISRYFICAPSMMIKRVVFDELQGYDESLSYEDFDFWIRSSRQYEYIFNEAPLVKKRILENSHAQSQKQLLNKHQYTTYLVCKKIYNLNRNINEYNRLITRCKYEIGQSVLTFNLHLVPKYVQLIIQSKAAQRRLSSPSSIEI